MIVQPSQGAVLGQTLRDQMGWFTPLQKGFFGLWFCFLTIFTFGKNKRISSQDCKSIHLWGFCLEFYCLNTSPTTELQQTNRTYLAKWCVVLWAWLVLSYLWGYLSNEIDEDILACPRPCGYKRQTVDFDNRTGMWLDLESEEDYDIVYVTVDEGNWNPVCILLALAVVM